MKKLRNLIAVMAMMSMAAVLTGCGDDDDNDDDDVPNPGGPELVAPQDEAALTAQNKTYTVQVAGQADAITLTFPAAGQYQMVQGATTETGTITGATRDVNTWTMNVIPAAGQDGSQEGVLRLDFTSTQAGTWTFTPTGGQAETGTFTVTTNSNNGTNGDTGNTDGTTPGTADLTGQTLQINYTGGGGDKFQFTSPTAVSWENGTDTGTYTWDPATRRFHAQLTGTGQVFDATLAEGGTTTMEFRENAGAQPQSFPGTYTFTSN